MSKLAVIIAAFCLISLAAEETFPDGSTGRTTVFQGAGGISIPAYLRRPAGRGPFPVVVMLHDNVASREETYALGRSTGHPTSDFIAAGWAVYSIDFRPNPPGTFDPREWDDAVAAIQAARRMTFIDPGRVALFGGGHGADVFTRVATRVRVRSAVLCAPEAIDPLAAYRLTARGEQANPQLPKLISMLEKSYGARIDEISKSPMKYMYQSAMTEAGGVNFPLLIIDGRNDTASPVPAIDAYVKLLQADVHHVETYLPDNGPHGFYFGQPAVTDETAEAARQTVAFIRTYFNAGGAPYEALKPLYNYDQKAPLDLKEVAVKTLNGIEIHDVTYPSPRGGLVAASIFVPPGKGPFAGMIFMHGGGGNRGQMANAAMMFAKTGAVGLTLDAPYSAGRSIPGQEVQYWSHPERTRDGFIQTVVDMRRGVYVLLARPDVDPKRLGFYGGSFGALTGGVLAGVEHRIKAYVLMSSPSSINDARIERVYRPLRTIPKEEIERSRAIIETVAPVFYVGHAAPSALFFQNGAKDFGITRESAERLDKAASEPKLVRWYDGDHGLNNQARLDSAAWLRKEIGIGPLDPADQKRLESRPRN